MTMSKAMEEGEPATELAQGTEPAAGTPGHGPSVVSPAKPSTGAKESKEVILQRLQAYFEEKGVAFEPGWSVEQKIRSTGSSAGTYDTYYFAPNGKRFRSRQEIARTFGLAEDRPKSGAAAQKVSRQEAFQRATAAQLPDLPLALPNGVTVTALGSLAGPDAALHTATQLWPLGYASRWQDPTAGSFLSEVATAADGRGLLFRVSLQPPEGSGLDVQVVGEGKDPDEAWDFVVLKQQAAFAAAVSRAKPLSTPSQAGGPASSGGAVPDSSGLQPAGGTPQPPVGDSSAGQGTPSVPSTEAANGHPGEAAAPELDAAAKLLVKAAPLAGVWGTDRFGFADTTVLKALEAMIPAVDACPNYMYVEQRAGGWDAEAKRLAKEAVRRLRAGKDVGKQLQKTGKVLKKEEQKAEKAREAEALKRKREEDRASERAAKKAAKASIRAEANAAAKAERRAPKVEEPGSDVEDAGRAASPSSLAARVARVVDRMVAQVEVEWEREQRRLGKQERRAEARQQTKAAKAAERESHRAERDREKEKAREEKRAEAGRSREAKQQARAAEQSHDVEDSLLPGAAAAPPGGRPVGSAALPPQLMWGVLEVCEFLGRFAEVLELPDAPDLASLEAALADPTPDNARRLLGELHCGLLGLLLGDVWEAALEGLAAAAPGDVRKREMQAAHPPLKADTWPEAARRYLTLAATALCAKQLDPGAHHGSGPLGVTAAGGLDGATVLQWLAAGPASADPAAEAAALPQFRFPRGHTPTAPEACLAARDAAARGEAERWLLNRASAAHPPAAPPADSSSIAGDANGAAEPAEKDGDDAEGMRVCRAVLRGLAGVQGAKRTQTARVLWFEGGPAALAARAGMALDFKMVAARVDAGVYIDKEHGMDAFAADVRAACELFRSAAKRSGSDFGTHLAERGAAEVADAVEARLRELLQAQREKQPSGVTLKLKIKKLPTPDRQLEDAGEDGAPKPAAPTQQNGKRHAEVVEDLSRPFAPCEGCCVCWTDADHPHMLLCDGCDAEYHTYCMQPPLEDIPLGEWFCPGCHARAAQHGMAVEAPDTAPGPSHPHHPHHHPHPHSMRAAAALALAEHHSAEAPSGGTPALAAPLALMARQLGEAEYEALSPESRVGLLELLCLLAGDAPAVRAALAGDEERHAEAGREARAIQAKIAKEQKIEEGKNREGDGAQEAAEAMEQAMRARLTRSRGPTEAAGIPDAARLQRLAEAARSTEPRRECLGADRAWRRYWLLSGPESGAAGRLYVEPPCGQGSGADAVGPSGATSQAWSLYTSLEDMDALIAFLNPRGYRESRLKRALQRIRPRLAAMPPPTPPRHGQQLLQPTNPPDDTGPTAATETNPDAELNEAADATFFPQQSHPSTNGLTNGAAEERQIPDAEEAPDQAAGGAEPPERSSPLAQLRQELEAFAASLPADAYSAAAGSELRQVVWREQLAAAHRPQELMAAVVSLEGMVRWERFKPHWHLWALPAPSPAATGTLAAVRMRLHALRGAIRRGATAREAAAPEYRHGGGGGYSLRQRSGKPMLEGGPPLILGGGGGRGGGGGGDGSDSGGKSDAAERAAEAAARLREERVRKRERERERATGGSSDEALARQLQEEMNGLRGRTRARTSHGAPTHSSPERGGHNQGQSGRQTRQSGRHRPASDRDDSMEEAHSGGREDDSDSDEPRQPRKPRLSPSEEREDDVEAGPSDRCGRARGPAHGPTSPLQGRRRLRKLSSLYE